MSSVVKEVVVLSVVKRVVRLTLLSVSVKTRIKMEGKVNGVTCPFET